MRVNGQSNGQCAGCKNGNGLDFAFTMAFQPIVDIETGTAFAYEALVRGTDGASAASILDRIDDTTRYAFDQQCRVAAINHAVAAGILDTPARLSINFLPNAVYSPAACIQLTLKTAAAAKLPTDRLIFEFTEDEKIGDPEHVQSIVECYRKMGFGTAIDDFGAGHAGLSLLARFQTDLIKLDMGLIRHIDQKIPARLIVEGVVRMCNAMGIAVIAEGIETEAEFATLRAMGVRYYQGYLFAKPEIERLPGIEFGIQDMLRVA